MDVLFFRIVSSLSKKSTFYRCIYLCCKQFIVRKCDSLKKLLWTTLPQKEKTNIQRLLQPVKETCGERGVSIVRDGCSDSQRRLLINFMSIINDQPMFPKAVDCSREVKDKYFIKLFWRKWLVPILHLALQNTKCCKQYASVWGI